MALVKCKQTHASFKYESATLSSNNKRFFASKNSNLLLRFRQSLSACYPTYKLFHPINVCKFCQSMLTIFQHFVISWMQFRWQTLNNNNLGRDGGQVVSVLAFFSDNPSSNPADVYSLHWATFETSVICYILMLQNETKIITKASKTWRSSLL